MRRVRHLGQLTAALTAVGMAVVLGVGQAPPGAAAAPDDYRWAKRIAAAQRFADGRAGTISFAVVDESGRLRGDAYDRVHHSASVVKVMLMIALLREPEVRDDELTSDERRLLGPMIRRSANGAASTVYSRLGADALYELAEEAGMDRFTTQPTWGLSTITAGEQARFFFRLERYIPRRHRPYAMRLLSEIVDRQRWGIPPVAPAGWKLHFKGGWSGRPHWRINQVMLLRKPGRRFAVAILTRDQPGKRYGIQTVRGVARRLLRGYDRITG
jgi:Beta-lactamase enzyme family